MNDDKTLLLERKIVTDMVNQERTRKHMKAITIPKINRLATEESLLAQQIDRELKR